ncbi:MAG: hypothetical protein ACRDTX_26235 [Pseudonocardiaceae bacterium]
MIDDHGHDDAPTTPPAHDRRRVVIHATCTCRGVARGFTNLLMRKVDGEIELDPHVTGCCRLTMDEDAGCVMRDALIEWLG